MNGILYIYIYIYIYIHYRFIVRFPIRFDFFFITYFLHFMLSWTFSLSISSSVISAFTFYNHVLVGLPTDLLPYILHSFIHPILVYPYHFQLQSSSSLVLLSFTTIESSASLLSNFNPTSYIFDELGWRPLFQRRQETRRILFYKIINDTTAFRRRTI